MKIALYVGPSCTSEYGSTPMRKLAANSGSQMWGLGKICPRNGIPVPGRP